MDMLVQLDELRASGWIPQQLRFVYFISDGYARAA
jgi:hypothetical protein